MEIVSRETLCKLHDTLNNGLFNGELGRAFIPKSGQTYHTPCVIIQYDELKRFNAHYDAIYTGDRILIDEEMFFDIGFLRRIADIKDERKQKGILASVMLHEMIHQYLHETGQAIEDDDEHGMLFCQAGMQHGYRYLLGHTFKNLKDAPQQQFRAKHYDLLPQAEEVIENFTLK